MAAPTPAQFRVRFPMFVKLPDDQIQAYLDAALARMNESVWGDLLNEGQLNLAAHLIALEPWAAGMRLTPGDGTSTWGNEYRKLIALVTPGIALT